jgi:hypothetical protein
MKNVKDINILRLTDIQDKTKDFMLSLLAEIPTANASGDLDQPELVILLMKRIQRS